MYNHCCVDEDDNINGGEEQHTYAIVAIGVVLVLIYLTIRNVSAVLCVRLQLILNHILVGYNMII